MYEKLLLPVDGSGGVTEVLQHAAELAKWSDATIQLLFVADTTRDSVTVIGTETVDALVEDGEDIVEQAADTLSRLGVSSETDVVQGSPAETIVEYADRYGYELIVLPTHARSGLPRYLLGSVTEKVVRLSSVPVLTARMQPDERLQFPYESILVPTDGSEIATAAAHHGLALAEALDASVHVLSVVDDSSLGPDVRSTVSQAELESAATTAVDDVVAAAESRDVPSVSSHVDHGPPARKILDRVDSDDVDAVVMGTTGRRGVDRILLGSVAEKTVRAAPVPVITVGRES